MLDIDELARRYLATWNERDPVRRRAFVDDLWTEDARYADPVVRALVRDCIATDGRVPADRLAEVRVAGWPLPLVVSAIR